MRTAIYFAGLVWAVLAIPPCIRPGVPLTPSPEVIESIEVNCYPAGVQTIWRGQDGIVKEWRHYRPEHEPGPTGMAVWWERGRFWMVQAEMLLRTSGFDREVQQRQWWPDEFRIRLR